MNYEQICIALCEIHKAYDGRDWRETDTVEDLQLEEELNDFLEALRKDGSILHYSIENVHNFESCGYDTGVVSVAVVTKDGQLIHDVFEWERC